MGQPVENGRLGAERLTLHQNGGINEPGVLWCIGVTAERSRRVVRALRPSVPSPPRLVFSPHLSYKPAHQLRSRAFLVVRLPEIGFLRTETATKVSYC